MSSRAILIASAAVAGLAGQAAEARTPLSFDAAAPSAPRIASEHARLEPAAFEPLPESAFEPNPELADPRAHLQCVPYAREESGVEIFGDASTWWRKAAAAGYQRAARPSEGSVLVLRGFGGSARGHVAVVREVVGERLMIVDHANWLNGGEITRDVPVRDVSERGDWSAVQVWHVPGAHWGGRTYRVQGFIKQAGARAPAPTAG